MKEPIWLSRTVLDSVQIDQLREHGGRPGIREENALEAALARARNKWEHDHDLGRADVAAAYGFEILSNDLYRDGNKRIAFLAMVIFLDLNGRSFNASEEDVVRTIVALASGQLSEKKLANWIRENTSKE
jgi:death-on-curing protein